MAEVQAWRDREVVAIEQITGAFVGHGGWGALGFPMEALGDLGKTIPRLNMDSKNHSVLEEDNDRRKEPS